MLVVLGRIQDQTSQRRSAQADDLDVETLDEHGDAPAGMGTADADVVEATLMAQGHRSAGVHLVEPEAPTTDVEAEIFSAENRYGSEL